MIFGGIKKMVSEMQIEHILWGISDYKFPVSLKYIFINIHYLENKKRSQY